MSESKLSQALHAAISRRDWHATEVAADAIRDDRLIAAAPKLKEALAKMLDCWGGYECPEVDAAILVMQEIGEDVWSMQAQMAALAQAEAEGRS